MKTYKNIVVRVKKGKVYSREKVSLEEDLSEHADDSQLRLITGKEAVLFKRLDDGKNLSFTVYGGRHPFIVLETNKGKTSNSEGHDTKATIQFDRPYIYILIEGGRSAGPEGEEYSVETNRVLFTTNKELVRLWKAIRRKLPKAYLDYSIEDDQFSILYQME
jgi:hypothetical protein